MSKTKITFIRKVGKSARISIPTYISESFKGKIVRVTIETIENEVVVDG